LHFKKKWYS